MTTPQGWSSDGIISFHHMDYLTGVKDDPVALISALYTLLIL